MQFLRSLIPARIPLPLNILIAVIVLAGCVLVRVADPEPVARLRLSVFDTFLRGSPRLIDPSFPVKIVAIDEASLARIGQWPWPRTKLAELVDRLKAAGVASITFDMVLAEPDRLSPGELARSLNESQISGDLIAAIGKLPSNDERLAGAIKSAPVTLGVVGDTNGSNKIAGPHASFSFAGEDPADFVHAYAGGIGNLPVLAQAASGAGAVNWLPSQDQIIRSVPLLVSIGGKLYPSLSLEALRVGTKQSTIFIKTSGGSGVYAFGQRTGIEYVRVGTTVLPSDGHGELWLNFSASDPRRTVSASQILDGNFNPADLRGRHVIIGATAAGLLDLRATPLAASIPGVEVHAQALEQMLSGEHLLRPAYASGAEIALIIAIGALVAWLVGRSGAVVAALAGGGAIAVIVALSWFFYTHAGMLFDPIYPALSVALLYLGTSLTSYVQSEAERAQIRSAFSHYVAPSLVAELAKNYDKLKLGGEMRDVTLLFSDVRGFSKMSEGFQPEDLIRFVNRLFTPLTDTILNHKGTIDKFMGDAVMAFWNAPLHDSEHAKNACRAALAMLSDIASLNEVMAAEARERGEAFTPVRMGIGLNTGRCVVGNVGSPQRFDYSILGDVVNVAARFEESTKKYGTDIIVGERTAAEASGFALLELGTVTPRGKDRPERIFALLGDENVARTPEFASAQQAHANYLSAYAAADAAGVEAALAACRKLSIPGMAGFYRTYAVAAAPSTPAP